MKNLEDQNSESLIALRKEHASELQTLEEALKTEHDKELTAFEADYKSELETLETQYEKQVAALKDDSK